MRILLRVREERCSEYCPHTYSSAYALWGCWTLFWPLQAHFQKTFDDHQKSLFQSYWSNNKCWSHNTAIRPIKDQYEIRKIPDTNEKFRTGPEVNPRQQHLRCKESHFDLSEMQDWTPKNARSSTAVKATRAAKRKNVDLSFTHTKVFFGISVLFTHKERARVAYLRVVAISHTPWGDPWPARIITLWLVGMSLTYTKIQQHHNLHGG